MLAIKFRRIGKKKQASFRVVVTEKRSKLNGYYLEDLGWFNPHSDGFQVNKEAAKNWLQKGAQPTDSVHNLLVKAGVIEGAKRPVHKKAKASEEQKAEVQKPADASAVPSETPSA